jgi:hypothetical protein
MTRKNSDAGSVPACVKERPLLPARSAQRRHRNGHSMAGLLGQLIRGQMISAFSCVRVQLSVSGTPGRLS